MEEQMTNLRTVRLIVFFLVLALTLGLSGFVSASTKPSDTMLAFQTTEEPTPVNIDEPIVLIPGQGVTISLDAENLPYRNFSFTGKANQIMTIMAQRITGNFGLHISIVSQTDAELASASGEFLNMVYLIVKLPQDGKYRIRLDKIDPGGGDFEAGDVSVTASEGTPMAAATSAATAAK
jgi:hypothetical protein